MTTVDLAVYLALVRSWCTRRKVAALTLFGQVFFLHHVQHLFRDRHVLDAVAAHVNLNHLDELVGVLVVQVRGQ